MTYEEALHDLRGRPAFAMFLKRIKWSREQGFQVLADTTIGEKEAYHVLGSMAAYTNMFDEGGGDEVIRQFEHLNQ